MKILYFDCFAGISGDMTVGALLDLGVSLETLQRELAKVSLPRSAYSLSLGRVDRRGISAAKFHVKVEEHQPHRHYADIAGMIEASGLAEPVRETAQKIFYRLAEAEAKVHGVEIGRVHFHEVGGVDSVIDIVGTAICLHELGIDEIHASPLPLGSGFIETAHGRLPIPAPAPAELLKGIPVVPSGPGERVTPTGAAILAALATGFGPAPAMTVTGTGSAAGDRDFSDVPNVLRVFCGDRDEAATDQVCVIETHLDDSSPEVLGFLMERLLDEGALDAAFSPLQMKKNRPGVRLTVVAPPELRAHLSRLILLESSAIGLRWHLAERMKLEREEAERETSLGKVKVKLLKEEGRLVRVAPEFEECRRIALERKLPLPEVYRIIERETGGR